jgi:hypothetical protein
MNHLSSWLWCGLLAGAALVFTEDVSAQTKTKPIQKLKTLSFTCRVVYQPSRTLWIRELEIEYSSKAFQVLRIDGVKTHGFAVDGANITTHLDNERIYLDLNIPSWKSQFREAAQGQGVCIKNR